MFRSTAFRRIAGWSKVLVAAVLAASTGSHAASVVVHDFDVFVDPPTGFVFIKLPTAWAFVGQVDDAAMRRLPTAVHTTLLAQGAQRPPAAAPL